MAASSPPPLTRQSPLGLWPGPCELDALLEKVDRLVQTALLQRELSERGDGDVACRVDLERLLAQRLGASGILLPLEERQSLVDKGEDVGGAPAKDARENE